MTVGAITHTPQGPKNYDEAVNNYAKTFAKAAGDGFFTDQEFTDLTQAYYLVKYFDQKTTLSKIISHHNKRLRTSLDKLFELVENKESSPEEIDKVLQKMESIKRDIALEQKISECTQPGQDTSTSLGTSRLENSKTLAAAQLFDLVRWDREILQGQERSAAIGYLKILGNSKELDSLAAKIRGVPAANVRHKHIDLALNFSKGEISQTISAQATLQVTPITLGGSKGEKQLVLEAGQDLNVTQIKLKGRYNEKDVAVEVDKSKLRHERGRLVLPIISGYEGLEISSIEISYEVSPKSITEQQQVQTAASGLPAGAQVLPKGSYYDEGVMGTWFYANNASRFMPIGDRGDPATMEVTVTAPRGWVVTGAGKIAKQKAWERNAELSGQNKRGTFTTKITLEEPTMLYATGLTIFSKKTEIIKKSFRDGTGKVHEMSFVLPTGATVSTEDLEDIFARMQASWNFLHQRLGSPPYKFPDVVFVKPISAMERRGSIEVPEDYLNYFGQAYKDYFGDAYPAIRDQIVGVFGHEIMHIWDVPTDVFWLLEGGVTYWENRMIEKAYSGEGPHPLASLLAEAVNNYSIRLGKEDSWPLVPSLDIVPNEAHAFDERFSYAYGAVVLMFLRHELGWDTDEAGKDKFDQFLADWRNHALELVKNPHKDKVDEADFFEFVATNTHLTQEEVRKFQYEWVSMPPTERGYEKLLTKIEAVFGYNPTSLAQQQIQQNQPLTTDGIKALKCEEIR